MNEAPGGEREPSPEPSPYIRLPWPAVALGLLVFIGLALAAGLYANRNLRPRLGVVATPAPSVALATSTPRSLAAPAPIERITPTATAALAVAAGATPTPIPVGLAPTPTTHPVVGATATALPTVEPALAEEVGNAYVTFWRVRSDAVLELDPSHLRDVMDGDYLQRFETRLAQLAQENRAIKTQVTLNYHVVKATSEAAIIHDQIEDESFYVDPETKTALTNPANDELRIEFKLARLDGAWKVVDSVTAE